jgi:hypothetical protein
MFGSFLRAVGLGDFARGFGGGARAAAPADSPVMAAPASEPPPLPPAPGPLPSPEHYLYTLPDGRQVPWIPFIHPSEQGHIQAGGQTPLSAFGGFGARAPAPSSPWGRQSPTPYPGLSSSSYAGRQSATPYPGWRY